MSPAPPIQLIQIQVSTGQLGVWVSSIVTGDLNTTVSGASGASSTKQMMELTLQRYELSLNSSLLTKFPLTLMEA